jgi:arsenite methyltransferase
VLQSVYNVLKAGGEFYFSDVYCDRRLPEKVRQHKILFGECIAGALYVNDFKHLAREIGFKDPRILEMNEIRIRDEELLEIIGNAKFYSITFRLFKLDDLEPLCEDYGQVATYNGTIQGSKHGYWLDDHHFFETGKPVLVCGNTASMLSKTWLSPHFKVEGGRDVHYGVFDCNVSPAPKKRNVKTSCC